MSLAKHQPPAPQKSSKASAFVAGFVLSAVLQPFEVLRTHIVLQGDRSLGTLAQLKKSFSTVYRAGGVAGLWRGAGISMLKNTFSVGIFFSSIEFFAHKLRRFKNGVFLLDRTVDISAAGIARFTSILSTNPLYLLKTRIESGMLGKETSIFESAKEIRRHSGLAGFYKGFWATMIRDVPYQGLQFSVYILLGELFGSFKQKQDDQLVEKVKDSSEIFLIGAISSVTACIVTQPFDAARIHQQMTNSKLPMKGILSEMYQANGLKGLYPGYLPRIMKKAVTGALTWTIFENITKKSIH